jgi:RimJ/RimL family protein N-acetyltransferase
MNFTYRKLVADDSAQYRKIRLESLELHPESFGSTYEEQSKLPKLKFEEALEEPIDDRFLIGAFDQGELIGICGFLPFVPDEMLGLSNTGLIIQVYVKSAYRGRKIGLSLVEAAIDEAFKISAIKQIVLGVREGNISAIRVYEQAGFDPYNPKGSEGKFMDGCERMMIIRRED